MRFPIHTFKIAALITLFIQFPSFCKAQSLDLPNIEALTAIDERYSANAESKVHTRPLSEETAQRMGGPIIDLPSLELLIKSLTTYTLLERDTKLKALETRQDGSWADLLPSLGVAYTPTGDPRPSASWSPLQILDRKDRKKQNRQAKESIILSYELLLTDRIYKLNQLYQDYMIDLQSLKTREEALSIDEKLFEITQAKYDQNLIKPSEYLKEKKSILSARAELKAVEMELKKKRNEIIYFSKYN